MKDSVFYGAVENGLQGHKELIAGKMWRIINISLFF